MGDLSADLQRFNADNCIVEPQGIKLAISEVANYDERATKAVITYLWWILTSSVIYIVLWIILWRTWSKK